MSKQSSSEHAGNTVRYEMHVSGPPDTKLVHKYRRYVATLVPDLDFHLEAHKKFNFCYGSCKFNQNIEEEWLIIYLLYQLSEYDRDLVIKIFDDDGDVLLIEAAEHLPSWLESSRSENRAFVHAGKLHIIPEHINLQDLQDQYSSSVTQAASRFVREMNHSYQGHSSQCSPNQPTVKTRANLAIQDAIMEQLSGMPDREVWLSKKYKQLDEIISDDYEQSTKHIEKKFKESLSLATVMAMKDEDLKISPISSIASSSNSSSSSSWSTDQGENG